MKNAMLRLEAWHFEQKEKVSVYNEFRSFLRRMGRSGGGKFGGLPNRRRPTSQSRNTIPASAASAIKQMGWSFFRGVNLTSTKMTAARAMAGQ